MRRLFALFSRNRRGTSAIEFALLVPGLLVFIAGIVELGRAFQSYGAVNQLATRYAISWADCSDAPSGTCQTEMALYTTSAAIKNMVPQLSNTVTVRMIEVTMSGTTPTVVYSTPSSASLTSNELSIAQSTIPSGQTGVLVTVNYTHNVVFFASVMNPLLGSSRSISYTVAQLKS